MQSTGAPAATTQQITIIKDSCVIGAGFDLESAQKSESTPTQTISQQIEKGRYNWIFYCFALIVGLVVIKYTARKVKHD